MKEELEQRIDNLIGMENVKEFFRNVIANQKMIKKIGMPLYIVSCKKGSGCTTISKLLADIVEEYQLLPRKCQNNYIELIYPYGATEEEYQKFFESPRIAAGITNQFYGVMCINISEWILDLEDEQFLKLIQFIKENRKNIIFILNIEKTDRAVVEEIQNVLEDYIYTEYLIIDYLSSVEYGEFVEQRCKEQGIHLPNDSEEILKPYIEAVRKQKSFRGYHTINAFISRMVYKLLEDKSGAEEIEISKEVLEKEAKDFFIKTERIFTRKKIGF